MTANLRAAVDSNIVYSAVRTGTSRLNRFWSLPHTDILVSQYVIEEVRRHLVNAEQRARLWRLLYDSHLIPDGSEIVLPTSVQLPEKDRPILRSAIAGNADYLVTGDFRHFGPLFGKAIEKVSIESTEDFMKRFVEHFYPGGEKG